MLEEQSYQRTSKHYSGIKIDEVLSLNALSADFFNVVFSRPCAMVVPDMELICEIMLMSEGFQNAQVLGMKFITLYRLCKELLSKQVQTHKDAGLQ